jgi:hypothetical protein
MTGAYGGGYNTWITAALDRPASAPASFTLHTGERFRTAAYDREIPHHYFVFDVLRHFDLPDLLAAIAAPGLLVNPIDGDWKRLREVEARAILGSARLQLACDAAGEDVSMRFRKLLSAAG